MNYTKSEAKEYAQEHFRGIFAAGMTPFKADGSSDEEG
jgi:4-hydroxy-tetrahydrodipicolinate synthase